MLALGASGLAGGAVARQSEAAPSPAVRIFPPGVIGEPIPLWPNGAPEPQPEGLVEATFKGSVSGVVAPRLEVFRPDPAVDRKQAVMVIPGGGYARLSLTNEAYGLARYLTPLGYTACVLVYRLPAEGWKARALAPLQDAQRGMRLIRAHCPGWGMDAEAVGLVGFSAGGHLGAMTATHAATTTYPAVDASDALSARPSFCGLVYPVISLAAASDRMQSGRNLLGEAPDKAQLAAYSANLAVRPDTPPTFLVHAADDPVVPAQNSLLMLQALLASGVKSELHLFQNGGHGFGLGAKTTAATWPDLFVKWARAEGHLV